MFSITKSKGLMIDLYILMIVINLALIWTTTSAGSNTVCHFFGVFYERNKYAHVFGLILLPLLVRFGVPTKEQE